MPSYYDIIRQRIGLPPVDAPQEPPAGPRMGAQPNPAMQMMQPPPGPQQAPQRPQMAPEDRARLIAETAKKLMMGARTPQR